MIQTTLKVTLTLQGPVLTRASGPAQFGFDAAMARMPSESKPEETVCVIPGTLVKGRLREAMWELHDIASDYFTKSVEDIFGARSGSAEAGESIGNQPHRGCLAVADFKLTATNGSSGKPAQPARHRIKIDETLGSVEKSALFVAEDAFGSGAEIKADGQISYLCETPEIAKAIESQLGFAFRWMTQLGAGRTTGFGRITAVAVEKAEPQAADYSAAKKLDAPLTLAVDILPHAPFCFTQHKIGGNLFESHPFIPGNAIKGALAEMCRAAGRSLPAGFNELRIRHAFPSIGKERACIAPFSIVTIKQADANGKSKTQYFDIAAHKKPVLLPSEHGLAAPAFQVDWKPGDFDACNEKHAWQQPDTILRVRTAMDSIKRKADEGNLFSQELILPGATVWRTVVDLSAILEDSERKQAAADLRSLFTAGLRYLGKTKATAGATIVEESDTPPVVPDPIDGTYRLTLQTPALLADPRFPENTDGFQTTGDVFLDHYAAVFHQLSEGALGLSHFFASQSLAGGNYLWQRFQNQKESPNRRYRPWLLTDPGSVFILTVKDEALAKDKLQKWLATGIPLPKWARDEFTEDWRFNPFLTQNGFGEIAVNLQYIPEPPEVIHV